MNGVGIFVFGVIVFAFVAGACGLILWGIITERRDREQLERDQARAREVAEERRPATLEGPRTAAAVGFGATRCHCET